MVELPEVKKQNKTDATASRQRSSLLRADHLRDEVDDGVGRLVGVQLGEEVADVVGCASLLPRHEAKQPGRSKTNGGDLGFPRVNVLQFHHTAVDSLGRTSFRFVPSASFQTAKCVKMVTDSPASWNVHEMKAYSIFIRVYSLSVLRVGITERHGVVRIVASEEQPAKQPGVRGAK